jgi:iron complex transport system permease protein
MAVILVSLLIGRYPIAPQTVLAILATKVVPFAAWWPPAEEAVVIQIRLPRILAALMVGAALSASGAAYQGVFRTPMVSPDILGVAAGCGFGAGLAILFGLGPVGIQTSSFTFGLLAVTVTSLIAVWRGKRGDTALTMVLIGIFVGAVFSALLSLLKFLADPANTLPAITFWLMGSLASITTRDLQAAALPIVAGLGLVWALRWRLDVLTFGDEEARALGVDVRRTRFVLVVAATLMTAAAVAISGIIALVGLIVPHIARLMVGPSHKILLPVSTMLGAAFLLLVDDLARSLSAELPLGVLTSLIGAPGFLYLLSSSNSRGWS